MKYLVWKYRIERLYVATFIPTVVGYFALKVLGVEMDILHFLFPFVFLFAYEAYDTFAHPTEVIFMEEDEEG